MNARPFAAALAVAVCITSLAVSDRTATTAQAIEQGDRAPEIGLRDRNGRVVRLANLRGKVVLVDFWATWCEPCRDALPELSRLQSAYGDRGLVVVGVSVDRHPEEIAPFARRHGARFTIVHDAEQSVAARYEPPRMPSSFLIDRRGVIRYVHQGFRSGDEAELERRIRELL